MPDIDRERQRVSSDHRSNVLKGSLPMGMGPPAHPRNTEDPSMEG